MPHRLLNILCYPISLAAWTVFVAPGRLLARCGDRCQAFAKTLPLSQYTQYPFGVLRNDQFDRFSAPLERRYTAEEVQAWLRSVGLQEVHVLPNWGWLGIGQRGGQPAHAAPIAEALEVS